MALQHLRSDTAHKRPVAGSLADGQLAINTNSASPGLFFKLSSGALTKVGPIHVGTTAPNVTPAGSSGNSPGEGWLDTSGANAVLKIWSGSAWIAVSSASAGDVVTTADTGTVTGTMIADGTIGNAEIASAAAIAHSKLQGLPAGQVLLGNGSGVPTATALSGDVTVTSAGVTAITAGSIVDSDIHAAAQIADIKLQTITTAGKVANAATTATSANTASAIVARDASGNFSAGTITATLTGAASTAGAFSSNRTFAISGDVSGSVSSNAADGFTIISSYTPGSIVNADISLSAEIADSKLATISSANKVNASALDIDGAIDVGGGLLDTDLLLIDLSGSGTNRKTAISRLATYLFGKVTGDITIDSNGVALFESSAVPNNATTATSFNEPEAIVARDFSGNFSASTIYASLVGNASTASALSSFRTFEINGDIVGSASANLSSGLTITASYAAGSIVNADISSGAAIADSKLAAISSSNKVAASALDIDGAPDAGGSLIDTDLLLVDLGGVGVNRSTPLSRVGQYAFAKVTGDITIASNGAASIGTGVIVNADINASAAIADSKLATISSANKVAAGSIDLDGATDAGTNLADADLILVDLGGTGANRKAQISRLATYLFGKTSGDITIASNGVASIATGAIVNADINASAAIADSKLATISSAGKVANSATTATSTNVGNAIVARDANGGVRVSSINDGPLAGFRNAIINGSFEVWQRGTSHDFTGTTAKYHADRWYVTANGTGAGTISREIMPLGTALPGDPRYFLRIAKTTAGSGTTYADIRQRIEGVTTYEGQAVTLGFFARASSSKTLPLIRATQRFGSGGTPSADAAVNFTSNLTLTTSWTWYAFTITLPSTTGKTVGTNNNDNLQISFALPQNTTYQIDFACVQLEPGSELTLFEKRPSQTEIALCQRYFHGPYSPVAYIGNAVGDANMFLTYPVPMRAVPTLNPMYTVTAGSSFAEVITEAHCSIKGTSTSGGSNNRVSVSGVYFDAEIG